MNNYENEEFKILNEALVSPINFQSRYSISVHIISETNRIGNPYFKLCNNHQYTSSDKVARVSFLKPELITGHANLDGKQEWKLENINSKIREELVAYLNDRTSSNLTVWTQAKIKWNSTLNIDFDKEKYGDIEYDKNFLSNPDYLPYFLPIPDYLNSLQNQK